MTPETPNPERDPAALLRLVLWRADKAVEAVENDRLARQGLCLTDFAILEVLLHKGPLPVNTIGKKVLLTSGSITSAVSRLQDKGMVTREADAQDRRVTRVRLTPEGQALITEHYQKHLECLREMAEALTPGERDTLVGLLKKLGRHAESMR